MQQASNIIDEGLIFSWLVWMPMVLFACGTLAYHFCLVFELPAWSIVIPFSCFLGISLFLIRSKFSRNFNLRMIDKSYVLAVIFCGVVLGFIMLVVSRPDADDVQFFYRVLVQIQDLNRPFITTTEIHNVKQLPFSSIGIVPFYELSIGLLSNLLKIDPLSAYHNISIFFVCVAFFITYILLYRQLGLGKNVALIATLTAISFLLLDGNVHRSFGNVTLVRMWQGKAILWSLIIPITILFTIRYLEKPDLMGFAMLFLCSVVGMGLSATGLFLIPAMVLATSLAYVVTSPIQTKRIKSAIVINLSSSYSILILVGLASGFLPTYQIEEVYRNWGTTWDENLKLVIPDTLTLIRNSIILLIVPIFVLPRPYNLLLPLISIVVCFLYLNPLTGPMILKLITAGSYWRLVYLLPLPLAAGLLGPLLLKLLDNVSRKSSSVIVLVASCTSILIAYQSNVLFPTNKLAKVWLKNPTEYRFRPEELKIARIIATTQLEKMHLLAPQPIIHIVPLINPNVSLETARNFNTLFVFANAALPDEGKRRVAAQKLVTDCRRSEEADRAFRLSVASGLNMLVIKRCKNDLLDSAKKLVYSTGEWKLQAEDNKYIFYIKRES